MIETAIISRMAFYLSSTTLTSRLVPWARARRAINWDVLVVVAPWGGTAAYIEGYDGFFKVTSRDVLLCSRSKLGDGW